jgi:hypothetical protein
VRRPQEPSGSTGRGGFLTAPSAKKRAANASRALNRNIGRADSAELRATSSLVPRC